MDSPFPILAASSSAQLRRPEANKFFKFLSVRATNEYIIL